MIFGKGVDIISFQDAFDQHEQRFKQLLKNQPSPEGHYLPHRIIIFRDGVSEGEFKTVFTQELGALQSTIFYLCLCIWTT